MQSAQREVNRAESANKGQWLKVARQWHLYLGTFFAPSILFFALSGALQLFGLHEGRPGESYQPPAWVAKMGSLHKNQTIADRRGPGPNAGAKPAGEIGRPVQTAAPRRFERRPVSKLTWALKWFFLATAVGLISTTFLGIYMSFKYNRSRALVWGMLLGGTAIPVVLIVLMTLTK